MSSPDNPASTVDVAPEEKGNRTKIKLILAGLAIVGVVAASQLKSVSDAKEVDEQYQLLLGVKDRLKSKEEKLKRYARYDEVSLARHAGQINATLNELLEDLEEAKKSAEVIGDTSIRFNPIMFEQLDIALDLAVRKLGTGKISRLHQEAGKMRKSRSGWGIYNRLARSKNVNPNSVIGLSSRIAKLKRTLKALQEAVRELNKEGIDGCTNNTFVESAIEEKLGEGHCDFQNSMFCQGIQGLTRGNDLAPPYAIAVQRKLIGKGLLKEGGDDGDFGPGSNKAFDKGLDDPSFVAEVKKCKAEED